MKKLLLFIIVAATACFVLSLSAFAAITDEFGTVEIIKDIDVSKMSTDDKALVVLYDGKEYHTYPANYIVKSSTDLAVDFTKINGVTGKGYGVSSIIRIQIPTTVKKFTTVINGNQGGKNIVEVDFPVGTQVTELVWGALMNCSKLERIEIPATVTLLGQDAFSSCAALTEVVFAENSQLKQINQGCFGSCKLLTEVVLPNSVEKIGKAVFYNCTGLKKLVLGANTTVFGGELDGAYGYNDKDAFLEIYINGAFSTGEGSLASGNFIGRGNSRDFGSYAIFFTGTREQALALAKKYNTDVNFKDVNVVAYDPSKTSGLDYLGMDAYTTDVAVNTNRVLVYGYGVCDAFYNGEHQLTGEITMNFVSYFEKVTFGDICTRNGCGGGIIDESKTIEPMFTYLGYSCTEAPIGGVYTMSQFYGINKESIDKYKQATGLPFSYGLVVSSVENPFSNELSNEKNTIVVNYGVLALDYVEIRLNGITESSFDTGFVFCVYVNDNGNVYYLYNGKSDIKISYNQVLKMS